MNDAERSASALAARDEQRDRRLAWSLLALMASIFVVYSIASLPRLTNVHFGDIEFTGWSGPMASRILRGERPYLDFVLPIPPGSFVVLAIIQKLAGRALLLQELALNGVLHLAMAFLAYRIARPFTSRKIAVFSAIATLATIIQLNKECAYDHTAQVVAWSSIAAGISALTSDAGARSRRLWFLAGALAGFTLAFKQSTGVGAMVGWLMAFAYLAGVEIWSGQRSRVRSWLEPLAPYAQGVGVGVGGVWLLLLLLGSTGRAYFQAVFRDASILKGGASLLVQNLTVYLFEFPAYPASLTLIAGCALVGLRLSNVRGTLHAGDECRRASRFGWFEAAAAALLVIAAFGSATWFLRKPAYPIAWVLDIDRLKQAAMFGLVPSTMLFVAHLVRTKARAPAESLRSDPERSGHVLNAVVIAAFVCSLMHNTSAPEFRPYYDNNAIIPLTFMMTFVVFDRARLEWASILFLALVLGSIFGNKYYRTMRATTKMDASTYWAGMRAGGGGPEIARAAARARELTKPDETVLVLPEDLELVALVGRPRPPLLGAIVFVDQYAPRLAADDIARLDENPPKVIIVHPRRVTSWQRFFRIWSGKSGAEAILQHVLSELFPKHYEKDSSFGTTFLYEPARLDLYVRVDGVAERHEAGAPEDTTRSEEPKHDEDAAEAPAQ